MLFTIDKTRDPDGTKFRSVLEVQLACERIRAARGLFAHLMTVTGVVIWLAAIWPNFLSAEIRFFSLAVFGANFLLFLRVLIEEVALRVRLKRCLKDNDAVTVEGSQGSN